jgi:hypothetical protein
MVFSWATVFGPLLLSLEQAVIVPANAMAAMAASVLVNPRIDRA